MAKKLLFIAHTPSENTLRLAKAMENGCLSDGKARNQGLDKALEPNIEGKPLQFRRQTPFSCNPEDLASADGILLFTTENFGYMSGALKDLFDRNYYPILEKTQGLPYALVVRAGQDGTGAVRSVESITTGLRWKKASDPLVLRGDFKESFATQAEQFSEGFAAGLQMGIF